MDAMLAIETVAAVCPRSADVMQAGNFGAIRVLAEYGTPDQKERYLKRLLAGEGVICVGMTEPEAGSRGDRPHDHRDARRRRATASTARRSSPRTRRTPT